MNLKKEIQSSVSISEYLGFYGSSVREEGIKEGRCDLRDRAIVCKMLKGLCCIG